MHAYRPFLCAILLGCPAEDPPSGDTTATETGGSLASETSDESMPSSSSTTGSSSATNPSSGPTSTPGTETNGDTDPVTTTDDDSSSSGGLEGQMIVIGVGAWGHRGMTADGETWVDIMNDPPPGGDDHTPDLLRGVGYGAGKFVAVGGDQNGMVMSTIDGETWDEDLFPAGDGWLGDVAYMDGIWVAVGGNGIVVRSSDGGETWSQNEERLDRPGRTIIAAEGLFVAAGDGGSLATSDDGLSWSNIVDPAGISFSIAHGLDVFVGFASQYNGSGFDTACIVSDDAVAWSPCPVTSSSFGRPAAGQDAIVVQTDAGYAVTTDGAAWQTVDGEFPSSLVHADGLWVGLSYQRRWWSNAYDGAWQNYEDVDGFRDLAAGVIAQ